MLGNSLTTANDLPSQLAAMLDAEVVVHARGGARLAEHLNPSTRLGGMTQAALDGEQWDFVVMQESSNGPVRYRARFIEAAAALCSKIQAANAKPVLYATWPYAPSCPKLAKMGLTREEMHAQLHDAYHAAGEAGSALVADVGQAFFEHVASGELYRKDGVHPSAAGTSIAADVISKCLLSAGTSRSQRPYTVYILRCEDGSFYTGITTDIDRRFQEHLGRGPKAARYTRTHPVVALEATWELPDRASASALEYRIKQLTHDEKRALIDGASFDYLPNA